MPPKTKITRAMVLDAAWEIARAQGAQEINARAVAARLGCSTQPVMYHFATIEALRQAVYEKADQYHTQWLLRESPGQDPLLSLGLNYIRFAMYEPQLFRFLFQSGRMAQHSLPEMIGDEGMTPLLDVLCASAGVSRAQAKEIFLTLALFTHGYASLFANNSLAWDENAVAAHLERALRGALLAAGVEEENA